MEQPIIFDSYKDYLDSTRDLIELAVKQTLVSTGKLSATVSKAEAIRMANGSRYLIERYINEGLIPAPKDGGPTSKLRIDRVLLETLLKTANRSTYSSLKIVARK